MENLIGSSLLFIAGMPAVGKRHFGKWLVSHHGYDETPPTPHPSIYCGGFGSAGACPWLDPAP